MRRGVAWRHRSVACVNRPADFSISAVANAYQGGAAGSVGVLLGNGDGTFRAGKEYAAGGAESTSVAVGDFNSSMPQIRPYQAAGVSMGPFTMLLGLNRALFWRYGLLFDGGSPCFAACVEASLAPSLSTMTCENPLVTSKATRRFWARPSAVSLLAIGLDLPKPLAVRTVALRPRLTR